jgi:NADH-quinone oxidoreductase subunit G
MLTIVIYVGSSYYVRGSDTVAEVFEQLIEQENLSDQVELTGAFCIEFCSMGGVRALGRPSVFRGLS